jgi:putative addiction module CopG family antidote
MGQTTLTVALPEELETYLRERVTEGSYASPGDYVRALIRDDRERRARATLDRLLLEGLDSAPELVTPQYLAELRRQASKRIERRRKKAGDFASASARRRGRTSSNWSATSPPTTQRQRLPCMTPMSGCSPPRSRARRTSAGSMPPAILVSRDCG